MNFSFLKQNFPPFCQWIFFLVLLPVLELFVLLKLFGLPFTLLSMCLSGLIGLLLAYPKGKFYLAELNQQLDRGETPMLPVLHSVLILLAVFLMILPGLLTSLTGLFLLFPLTRAFVVSYLLLQFEAQRLHTKKNKNSSPPEVIDV